MFNIVTHEGKHYVTGPIFIAGKDSGEIFTFKCRNKAEAEKYLAMRIEYHAQTLADNAKCYAARLAKVQVYLAKRAARSVNAQIAFAF